MFREMMRFKQAIPREECIRILQEEKRGVLSVLGDDDYPYGMPINHWYCPEDGKIYFHGGRQGHKIDAIRRHDKVSFCVYDSGFRKEGDWALNIKSVIVFGRVEIVEDEDWAIEVSRRLSRKFTQDEDYIQHEVERSGPRTLVFALQPEHMTGKLVNES
ncbi:MAG: pyridoxamine 5'-phosphate oxidase family protein [Oscillospiraceae bacterium]|nr:pyridoxamine 5'-phosphate oxidase family protein [Oscillospiraceae bacterium]MBQ5442664.1 pyridoxamine 5'-phosphate oxidase family protein [Oscillospiraceae bacterium]